MPFAIPYFFAFIGITKRSTMVALPAAWRIWFVLFVCLLGLSTTRSLTAAEPAGMLAVVQPARDEHPAILKLYSPEAQLVHEIQLPASVAVSGPALSPDGLHLATLRGEVSLPHEALRDDLTLNILRTTDLEVVHSIPLLPSNFPSNIAINADLVLARDPTLDDYDYFDFEEALWLVFASSLGMFEWSPDGKQLAFSAAIDGPSTDLYLYDVEQESVTRLTDGIEQIYGLSWSPDGNWIWHTTISYGYCQACGGHNYAAAADGSKVVTLPGDDVYLFRGWVDGDSYLVTDQANGPGAFDLQLVDVPTGKSQTLWPGVHRRYIYDPDAKRLGVLGTVGRTFDPNEQVFVVNLATGDIVEYDELETALEGEPWLAPLNESPVTTPCGRPGPLIYPCLDTPFDPLSPDGVYLVGEDQQVVDMSSGVEVLPPLPEVANGRVFWRPDSAGYYINQSGKLTYRDLITGETTEIKGATLLGWLPRAVVARCRFR
jgi:hypothetical protein